MTSKELAAMEPVQRLELKQRLEAIRDGYCFESPYPGGPHLHEDPDWSGLCIHCGAVLDLQEGWDY